MGQLGALICSEPSTHVGDDPRLGPQEHLDGVLLDSRVLLLELVREAEGDDGQRRGVGLDVVGELSLGGHGAVHALVQVRDDRVVCVVQCDQLRVDSNPGRRARRSLGKGDACSSHRTLEWMSKLTGRVLESTSEQASVLGVGESDLAVTWGEESQGNSHKMM